VSRRSGSRPRRGVGRQNPSPSPQASSGRMPGEKGLVAGRSLGLHEVPGGAAQEGLAYFFYCYIRRPAPGLVCIVGFRCQGTSSEGETPFYLVIFQEET